MKPIASISASFSLLAALAGAQVQDAGDTQDGSAPTSESQSATSTKPARGGTNFGSATSVGEEIREDRTDAMAGGLEQWNAWKESLKDRTGFEFSLEYNSLMQRYSDEGIGEDLAAGGIFRLAGRWTILNRDEDNYGAIVYRVDHRHSYTSLAPQTAGIAAGSAVPTATLYSDREWGLVNLHWTQAVLGGRGGYAVGWFPADDYFHSYALANPLTGFSNLAFSVGADFALPDSGIGAAAAFMLDDHWYVKGGVHDANGNAADVNFDVFGDWELYKNLELGWTSEQARSFLDNFHVGAWHSDVRKEAGVPEDWGLVANASWYFEDSRLAPFLRAGWSDQGAALLKRQVSTGIGKNLRERDLAGIGISWGSPSAPGTRDQWTAELFYRIQLRNLAITPSVQFITNPALNPSEDTMLVGGLRARIVF
jgi:porin